ncbi:hypothetical protein B0H67DRAFT_566904 [Lasiosphaeris hirsuta]|uniref:Uncharacterized protein n=1 Tax=Lasiosphaeris hirsuta TaxID=260670 RepID=A0AA40BDE8_9PEZI|nr:hypothetical protein B0H67DRAFT_566904 [Lasiosphaeris hirsuta]
MLGSLSGLGVDTAAPSVGRTWPGPGAASANLSLGLKTAWPPSLGSETATLEPWCCCSCCAISFLASCFFAMSKKAR